MSGADRGPATADAVSTGSDYDAHGKSSDEIERDIAATRAEMAGAVGALQSMFAPQQLLAHGINAFQHSVTGGTAPAVPPAIVRILPWALIGVGILLLSRPLQGGSEDNLAEYPS